MAKLDSIIRKKVLDARPPIKGANWQEMEVMLAGAQKRKKRGGWLFFADAGAMVLLGLLIFCGDNKPATPHEHHDHATLPPQTVAPALTPPAEVTYEKSYSPPKNHVPAEGFNNQSSVRAQADSFFSDETVLSPSTALFSESQSNEKSTASVRDVSNIAPIPLPYLLLLHHTRMNREVSLVRHPIISDPSIFTDVRQAQWMRSRWALEVHLNNVHAPVYWGQDSVKRFFSNYNSPGIGVSFLRRRSHRYTWGLRLDLDVPSYPVDTSPDDPFAYSRMWGGGWDLGFFMRQYMNDDPEKRFRPYFQAGLGYNIMGMNAYNISRIDNPYDDPKTQWILRKSRLEEESITFYPFETYIHMNSSGGIGAELRLYRRVSFTMCSVLYANMLINKDRLNNPDQYWGYNYYLKHSFGLQYGF